MSQVTETRKGKPTRERMAAWRERMKAEGLAPITEWVPVDGRDLLRSIARTMREMSELRRSMKEVDDKQD